MKKLLFIAVAAMMMVGCTKQNETEKKQIVVRPDGDITYADFRHIDVTDVWIFGRHDGGGLEELAHGAWFEPIALPYGHHELYIVASGGKNATIDGEAIWWDEVGDTFWGCLVMDVDGSTQPTQYVNMRRDVAKLDLVFTDTGMHEAEHVTIYPSIWFNGIIITDNMPIYEGHYPIAIGLETVPYEPYSAYTFSVENEWVTDIILTAYNDAIGEAEHLLEYVPFTANRITQYSGRMWSEVGSWSVAFDDEWHDTIDFDSIKACAAALHGTAAGIWLARKEGRKYLKKYIIEIL